MIDGLACAEFGGAWQARRAAEVEREVLAAWAVAHGEMGVGDEIQPWDWRYFAEKVRAVNEG